MSLEQKLDELIPALAKHTEALTSAIAALAANGVATTPATVAKPAGKGKTAAAAAPVNAHTQEEVTAKFDTLKGDKANLPGLKKVIADLGFAALKDLLADPTKHDAAFDALEAFEATLTATAEPDDDL